MKLGTFNLKPSLRHALSLSFVLPLLAIAQVAAPVAAVPIELRRVNGTNYNIGALRAYEAALQRWAAKGVKTKEPVRPLPDWDVREGKILEEAGDYLIVEFIGKLAIPFIKIPGGRVAVRNVPAEKRQGRRFSEYVMRTDDAFQTFSERLPVFDYGKPVATPAEPASAAAERAEAAAKAAAAKKAALDAAVAKFRAEQSAAK